MFENNNGRYKNWLGEKNKTHTRADSQGQPTSDFEIVFEDKKQVAKF